MSWGPEYVGLLLWPCSSPSHSSCFQTHSWAHTHGMMLIHLFTRWSVDVQSPSLSKPYIFRRLWSRNSTGSSALLRRNYSDVLPLGVWSSESRGAHSVRHPLITTHSTCIFTVKHTSFRACLAILAHSSSGTAAFSCPGKSSAEENLGPLLDEPKFNKKKIQCGASNLCPSCPQHLSSE